MTAVSGFKRSNMQEPASQQVFHVVRPDTAQPCILTPALSATLHTPCLTLPADHRKEQHPVQLSL